MQLNEKTMTATTRVNNAFLAVEIEEKGLDIAGNIIAKLRNDPEGPSIKFTKC